MSSAARGRFTIRTSAVLFLLSAVLELASPTSAVVLADGLHEGTVAMLYHAIYSVVFLIIGAGLWLGRPWGYQAVFAGTLLYTVDKILLLLSPPALQQYLQQQLGDNRELMQLIDLQWLESIVIPAMLLMVLCWWGFALYIYYRRRYFYPRPA